jgi:hypothetical protein
MSVTLYYVSFVDIHNLGFVPLHPLLTVLEGVFFFRNIFLFDSLFIVYHMILIFLS